MSSEDEKYQTKMIEILVTSFDQKLDKLSGDPSYSYAACIYNVSDKLRAANEGAYTPRLVSIGPLHHDRVQLHGMESYKLKFMNNFLSRFAVDLHALVQFAAREESFVRGCYEGKIHLSPEQLTEVIVLDGIFIVELFLENYFVQLRDKNEVLFLHHYMYNDLLHDMLLLENQLPIRIMKSLLSFVDLSFIDEEKEVTIYSLAHKFFKYVGNTHKVPLTAHCYNARHFIELLLFLHDAPAEKPGLFHDPESVRKKPSPDGKFEYSRSVTELQEAGVKFKSGEGNCLFEVPFAKDKGDSQQVANLFNTLYKDVVTEANDFYFAELCGELNEYHKDRLHQLRAKCFRWRGMLKRNYFSNPWSFLSVLAATVLLILTVIQTVCSILQV
ncbi:uncharacterized protein LOC125218555 isoform X2 [Salvia hispanica]|uniref:uncharacterized protein LOC125218555 isoform X2 n=1 Tax=Salvia hispanica TaxID=49212 RepID=UPI0020091DB3|nr:uncharacterized protein LOC125218555 isoform X2 [Salvia hispanica]